MSPFYLYFAGIGLGFLLVEISQLQRLSIFLGHPTYALTVVLFSLLLAERNRQHALRAVSVGVSAPQPCGSSPLGALLVALVLFAVVEPRCIHAVPVARPRRSRILASRSRSSSRSDC